MYKAHSSANNALSSTNASFQLFPSSTPDNADPKRSYVTNNYVSIPDIFLKADGVHRQISTWLTYWFIQTFLVGLFHF